MAHLNLSACAIECGATTTALEESRAAVSLLETLPLKDLWFEKMMIAGRSNLGVAMRDSGDPAGAVRELTRVVEQLQAHESEFADDPDLAFFHASALEERALAKASLAKGPDREREPIEDLKRAAGELRKLTEFSPHIPIYQRELAVTLNRRGVLEEREGRHDDALADSTAAPEPPARAPEGIPRDPRLPQPARQDPFEPRRGSGGPGPQARGEARARRGHRTPQEGVGVEPGKQSGLRRGRTITTSAPR